MALAAGLLNYTKLFASVNMSAMVAPVPTYRSKMGRKDVSISSCCEMTSVIDAFGLSFTNLRASFTISRAASRSSSSAWWKGVCGW